MSQPVYLATAIEDFSEILAYVTRESGSLKTGQAFVTRLRDKCAHIASLSGKLGTDRSELARGLRSTTTKGYVIFFRYRDDCVEIVNVLHGSRDMVSFFDG